MSSPEIIHSENFVADAVGLILKSAREAIAARGEFRIALSGGRTPRKIYAQLATAELPWDQVFITFGDERCVPPDDEQSNYRMARESLLDAAPIPGGNVLRMRGELSPEEAAAQYETDLAARAAGARYVHDLLLLGLGDDGHTASLFPGTGALAETERNVVANFVPKFSTHRLTFTFPLINAARHVCFLVDGNAKAPVVDSILRGGSGFPAERVAPVSGRLTWLLGF